MVLRIKLTVFRTADFALCLVLAGRFPAGVLSQLLAAIITLVVFVIVCTLADYIIADITFVVFVCIDAIYLVDGKSILGVFSLGLDQELTVKFYNGATESFINTLQPFMLAA